MAVDSTDDRGSIGAALEGSRRTGAVVLAAVLVAVDGALVSWRPIHAEQLRWAAAVVALLLLTWLTRGNLQSLGLVAPVGGTRRWMRVSLVLGFIVGGLLVVAGAVTWLADIDIVIPRLSPAGIAEAFSRMCIVAPLLEETIYRIVLCVAVTSACGPKWAVAVSGTAFGLLHVLYGNPSPENLAGGFLLAWAYLASGSVAVPLLLHAVGNLLVLVGQLAAWFLLPAP